MNLTICPILGEPTTIPFDRTPRFCWHDDTSLRWIQRTEISLIDPHYGVAFFETELIVPVQDMLLEACTYLWNCDSYTRVSLDLHELDDPNIYLWTIHRAARSSCPSLSEDQ